MTGRDQRRLVADIGDVGTRKAGRLLGQESTVQLRIELQRTQVHVENLLALLHVGQSHLDLPVETSGTHQRLVQNIDPVGRRQDDHARIGLETVHLGQQLVERILPLVIAREPGVLATGPADGVDFVDEKNTGSFLLGLLEKVTHARSAHAHEHLHEIRAGNRQERHIGLSRHRLRQQGFTRSRRAYQQRALGNFRTDGFVFVGFLEEIDDLHDLDLCLLQSGNVLESHLFRVLLVEHLRPGLPHVHNTASTASGPPRHAAHQEEPAADNNDPGKHLKQNRCPGILPVLVHQHHLVTRLGRHLIQILTERIHRPDIESKLSPRFGHITETRVNSILTVPVRSILLKVDFRQVTIDDLDFFDVALLDHLRHGIPVALDRDSVAGSEHPVADNKNNDDAVYPHPRRTRHIHFVVYFLLCHKILFVILITGRRGIGPQLLQFVKFTQFCLKNMHHHIHVVHSDPQRILLSFHAPDLLAEGFQYLLLDTRRDRSDLRGGVGVANDEAGADRPVDFRKIQRYDIFTLFILDCTNYRACQFFHSLNLPVNTTLQR